MKNDSKRQQMMDYLKEVESVLPKITNWKPEMRDDMPAHARAFTGSAEGWKVVVVDFDISDQGFPPGTRGYDGAAHNFVEGVVLHLSRELAEKALQFALSKTTD